MEKKEILEVLKEMLADYESALIWICDDIDFDFEDFDRFLETKHLSFGFCNWLRMSIIKSINHEEILEQLLVDYDSTILENGFWYFSPISFFIVENTKAKCLLPRAKHLLRTIERLENELK